MELGLQRWGLFGHRRVLTGVFLLQAGAIKNGTVGTIQAGGFLLSPISTRTP